MIIGVFPVLAVAYPNIYSSISDGYTYNTGAVYNTVRTAVNALSSNNSSSLLYLYNGYNSGTGIYSIYRSYLYFDTSVFSGYTITAASINIYVSTMYGDTDNESIQVQSGMPTYPHDPLVVGDYDLANYVTDTNCGTKDITTFSALAYNSINLDASGIAEINTSGWTKFCLRTTGDINNIAPTGGNGFTYYSAHNASYKPYLVVTYTALAPSVDSVAASNIATTSARLNSDITEDGGDPNCEVRFGYGTTSKLAANFATYDTVTTWVAGYDESDNPFLDIAGLVDTTTYFFRVQVKNEFGTVTSVDEQTFDTLASVDDMTSFIGLPDVDNIALSWGKADGATNTLIRYRTDTYPTTTADGTLVYNNTGVSYTHTGLTGGVTYFYSAWGESGGVYSANEINLVMTTSDTTSKNSAPTGGVIGGLMQEPVETFLSNLQPFYSVINGLADTWGMPRGNMWLGIALLICMVIGGGLYIAFRSAAMALLVMSMVMAGFVALHILPVFFIIFVAFGMLGAWATRPSL